MPEKSLREKLKKEVLLLDGGFGTYADRIGLSEERFGGKPGCMEYLSVSDPDFVKRIHDDYFRAGADAVETNTFGANRLKLAEFGLADKVYDMNRASTELARAVAGDFFSGARRAYVVGTMGPTGKLPSSNDPDLGAVGYAELKEIFFEQALGIIDGGADALLVETAQDLLEMKAAVNGARKAIAARKKDLVLMAQCTLSNNGRMLLGTEISAVSCVLAYLGAEVIGLNCSTGPVEMEPAVKYLSDNCPAMVSCVPNAGLPVESGGKTVYSLGPDDMSSIMRGFLEKYRIDVIGGCCGTGPEHIKRLKEIVSSVRKKPAPKTRRFYSGFYRGFDMADSESPVKVGERINTHGSKKMKELLMRGDHDGIVELGKDQERAGAGILDICAVLTERKTEREDTVAIFRHLADTVEAPLMVDSTDVDVIKAALESYSGTAFVNSVNLEDTGVKARQVFSLAKEHAGFIVNLVIDSKGMARTADDKVHLAEKLLDLAVKEFKIEPHRMIFDMLTFTLGTGEAEYASSALETYRAIKKFKAKHPEALTILGVSNVSFGLPRPGRKLLNMVFLHHAVLNGLDLAIINPADFFDINGVDKTELKLAEDLVFNRDKEALNRFVEYFSRKACDAGTGSAREVKTQDLSIEEKIRKCVFDRDKKNITTLLGEALKVYPPDKIIDDILMSAMREVGDKLDSGEMVLPFVLQSAEVMKKALEYLEKYMDKEDISRRGSIVLATVAGDVHDIGKNLVKMILANHGFNVIDLGKQVSVEEIISQAVKHKVDAVGLSALLVSTARHMKSCVQAMSDAGLEYPVLIGGAPVNSGFARDIAVLSDRSIYKGGVFYSRDAFAGLKTMQALMDARRRKEAMETYFRQFVPIDAEEDKSVVPGMVRPGIEAHDRKVPVPPFYGVRTLNNISVDEVFRFLDKETLFNVAWGAKLKDKAEKERLVKKEYAPLLEELKQEAIRKGLLDLKAVYGHFRCRVSGEEMAVLNDAGETFETIRFERGPGNICLADYFISSDNGQDLVSFQAVTVGNRINKAIEVFTGNNEIARAFFLNGFSVYLAEATAAYTHDRIRKELGLGEYDGKRYSPGYPLWRDIKDQKKIFRILDIEKRLGVKLTEDFQMIPEHSTTAMIVYEKSASY